MDGLRPYQEQAISDIRDTVRSGVRRLIIQAATGAGKTKLAAAIFEGARSKGNPCAFVVPAISLVDQTVEAFWNEGIRDVGVIQGSHEMTDWSRPVQVCSIQTIRSRKVYPRASVVIFDEIHQFHKAHEEWLGHPDWATVPMFGLSATPWTRGLGKYFDSLLVAATTQDLINQGYLSKFKVFASGHPDLTKVRMIAGDYHEGELSEAMQQGELTADIVRTWKAQWGKGKTLCFGVDKLHAKSIQERFEHAGISCGYQDADTLPDERREIKKKFHNGEYQVVSNIQTLTTGVDWDVRCLIMARPTRSEMLYVQIIGRALRTAPGKDCALILDHSDTTQRLGFVTEIHHDALSSSKKSAPAAVERKKPLPKECEKCQVLKPRSMLKCPNCGHEEILKSNLMENDGDLIEVSAGSIRAKKKKFELSTPEKIKFLAELKAMAIQRGYKLGWAANQYKQRVGTWPADTFQDVAPAKIVSPDTALWVRAQQIRWAKSKGIRVVGMPA